MPKTQAQYRIQFVRIGHLCGRYNRYYKTKQGVLKRLLSLFRDPLVWNIEVAKGDRSRLQPFYCAHSKTYLNSKAGVEGSHRWYIPSWGWGSWKALSVLLEVEEAFWQRFTAEEAP